MISYAVIDSSTVDFNDPEEDLKHLSLQASMIVYRDKKNPNYESNATKFITVCKTLGFEKVFIHSKIALASQLEADGVHLTSRQFGQIKKAKQRGLFVIISTHTKQEAMKAQELGANMVTFSPIFATPDKGEPLGVDALAEICSSIEIPVIALGGILGDQQIDACRNAGAKGFASIRYFSLKQGE
jgi:thiamine-phosphate pyrophosphorylase